MKKPLKKEVQQDSTRIVTDGEFEIVVRGMRRFDPKATKEDVQAIGEWLERGVVNYAMIRLALKGLAVLKIEDDEVAISINKTNDKWMGMELKALKVERYFNKLEVVKAMKAMMDAKNANGPKTKK